MWGMRHGYDHQSAHRAAIDGHYTAIEITYPFDGSVRFFLTLSARSWGLGGVAIPGHRRKQLQPRPIDRKCNRPVHTQLNSCAAKAVMIQIVCVSTVLIGLHAFLELYMSKRHEYLEWSQGTLGAPNHQVEITI